MNISTGDKKVCCKNVLPPIDPNPPTNVCSDNPGKSCLPTEKCDLNSTILTNSITSSLIDIRSNGQVDLNADANLCNVDNEVCCSKIKVTPIKKTPCHVKWVNGCPPPYEPRCGQRNSDGSGLRITNPTNKKEATQQSEWPHACILYEKKSDGEHFLGGGSLIAPGIVVTASHKIK